MSDDYDCGHPCCDIRYKGSHHHTSDPEDCIYCLGRAVAEAEDDAELLEIIKDDIDG